MCHMLIHLDIEVDTGATSVILEATRVAVFPNDTLHPSDLILTMCTDEHIKHWMYESNMEAKKVVLVGVRRRLKLIGQK